MLRDSFADDTWYYVYHYKSGRDASITPKELILHFNGNKLSLVKGDYELSPEFNTPLEQSKLPMANSPEATRANVEPLIQENPADTPRKKPAQ